MPSLATRVSLWLSFDIKSTTSLVFNAALAICVKSMNDYVKQKDYEIEQQQREVVDTEKRRNNHMRRTMPSHGEYKRNCGTET